MRFTIRDLLWLMVVIGLLLALMAEHRQNAAATRQLQEVSKAKEIAEFGWQNSVVEHNKTLRLLEENGLETVGHPDGTTTLRKANRSGPPGAMF